MCLPTQSLEKRGIRLWEGSENAAVKATGLSGLIEVVEDEVCSHLSEVVRESFEETLDPMLEAQARGACIRLASGQGTLQSGV
jgi:hypothetical protein